MSTAEGDDAAGVVSALTATDVIPVKDIVSAATIVETEPDVDSAAIREVIGGVALIVSVAFAGVDKPAIEASSTPRSFGRLCLPRAFSGEISF